MIAIHKERDTPQRKKTLAKPRKLPSMREIQPNSISETQQPLVISSCPTRVVSELHLSSSMEVGNGLGSTTCKYIQA
jgi:hypothetical protein